MDYVIQKKIENLIEVTGHDFDIVESMGDVLEVQIDEICVASFYKFEIDRLMSFLDGVKCASLCNL